MRQSRFSGSLILAILKQNDQGVSDAELCRQHGMSQALFYKYGDQVRRYGYLDGKAV